MSWQSNLVKIGFKDRKEECNLFRRILYNETPYRGIVVHSNGEGGLGKSTLLKMFEEECRKSNLPLPTEPMYFTADRQITWRKILSETFDRLGRKHFDRSSQLWLSHNAVDRVRNTFSQNNTQPTSITYIENVQGFVHAGSGDNNSGAVSIGAIGSEVGSVQHRGPVEAALMSREDYRQQLTRVFLEELNIASQPRQLVWLVDKVENLDEETKAWLVEVFWEIVDQKTTRLILIVAGQERLRHEPHWLEHVVDLMIGRFTLETVTEILSELWPNDDIGHCTATAELLVRMTEGRPLEIRTEIERYANRRRAT